MSDMFNRFQHSSCFSYHDKFPLLDHQPSSAINDIVNRLHRCPVDPNCHRPPCPKDQLCLIPIKLSACPELRNACYCPFSEKSNFIECPCYLRKMQVAMPSCA